LIRLLFLRIWLILLLVAVAQGVTWYMTRDNVETYEHRAVFVIRPSVAIPDDQIPDALRGISAQDGELPHTVSRALESKEFLGRAFQEGVGTSIDPSYTLDSSTRPGSHVIEVAIRGPNPALLSRLARAFSSEAREWVARIYRAYALDLLEIEASDGPVSPSRKQLIALASVLGALLGFGLVLLERQSRERKARAEPHVRWQPEPADDLATRVSQLERVVGPYEASPASPRRRRGASVEGEPRVSPTTRER
jgi:hypothetical protein